jgi:hypothetical protein
MAMEFLRDRRTLMLLAGALGAIAMGVIGALLLRAGPQPTTAPPASQGGLVIQMGRQDDTAVSPNRQIRCFVGGQFVGEIPLADCARRNGVATGALDVGVDSSGALAGSNGTNPQFTPLPPPAAVSPATPPAAAGSPADQGGATSQAGAAPQDCWRYASGGWRAAGSLSLNACVQSLFSGRCEHAGSASYGRWGEETLRLVPGRVEVSDDNRSFRTLVEQPDETCVLPAIG